MSSVIKFFQYKPVEEAEPKIVAQPKLPVLDKEQLAEMAEADARVNHQINEIHEMKNEILRDAEMFAEETVRTAMEETEALKERAQNEIDAWWEERRSQDLELIDAAMDRGFTQGYQEGQERAEAELREQYASMIQEAASILEQAYTLKQVIVQESEPFLIDMSCSIAEKIVGRQLTVEPEWMIDLIRKSLARRREKGIIALCVSPAHFSQVQDAREELLLHLDPQAELQIIPDASVQDQGCVIRSSFGSIDSRIDTQLGEIKNALRQIAITSEVD